VTKKAKPAGGGGAVDASRPSGWPPDWRRPEDYAHLSGRVSRAHWAWEFLRRNPKYQDANRQAAGRMASTRRVQQSFGLASGSFPDPADDSARPVFAAIGVRGSDDQKAPLRPERHEIVVALDLQLPWPWQEPRIREVFERFAALKKATGEIDPEGHKKIQPHKYPLYLRLLDALAAGATAREIVATIYAGAPKRSVRTAKGDAAPELRKTFADDRVAALKLRDGGYRYLTAAAKFSKGRK
jgi:hypothetical protein